MIEVVRALALFLTPVLEAATTDLPFPRSWEAEGPWR
jgi:hypothetical protein